MFNLYLYKMNKQREIKFRAWLPIDNVRKNSKMVYFESFFFVDSLAKKFPKIFYSNKLSGKNAKWVSLPDFEDVKVMQFTGLKDLKGKEIYEGDIVKVHEDYLDDTNLEADKIGVVEFDLDEIAYTFAGFFQAALYNEKIHFEIIGNIFENPELLDKVKQK